jgi:hypothetical protein
MRIIPIQTQHLAEVEDLDLTSDGARVDGHVDESMSRRTFGGRFPSRRTFGGRFPSRRTFGGRFPSRRTFGIRWGG